MVMGSKLDNRIYANSGVQAGDLENTEEERKLARRAVCGARACKNAGEAKLVLEILGLI